MEQCQMVHRATSMLRNGGGEAGHKGRDICHF